MKKILCALFFCGLAMLVAAETTAQAFKPWEFSRGKTMQGRPQCTLYSSIPKQQSISVFHFGNEDFARISIYDSTWKFPSESKVTVEVDFFDNKPLHLVGVVDGRVIDFQVPREVKGIFLSLLGSAATMKLTVNGNSEDNWVIPLKTAKKIMPDFLECAAYSIKEKNLAERINEPKVCERIRFTGLAAPNISEIEDALKENDLKNYLLRNPILCRSNNLCKGIGWFVNQKAINKNSWKNGYMSVVMPLDLTTGSRDIYMIVRNADVVCDK